MQPLPLGRETRRRSRHNQNMKTFLTRLALIAVVTSANISGVVAQAPPAVAVYKSATCGCCAKWVEHLRANGFAPTATNVDDLTAVKTRYHVPAAVQSCHTALVGGYVIEGHVPAEDIRRLLKERPAVAGLAVAGMPAGSPGMDAPNAPPFDVVSFDKEGKTRVYATHAK
jgi:hypothetical protein